ncbi:hypothetical protein [Veillonella agrestimuris]|uniref:hypothetical protein n=1 Tax=Veillonella agrestimuris TaxID=2941340 RepID=UPI00203FE343|nr:hypothetical protein [Veillonella agrestimuris]
MTNLLKRQDNLPSEFPQQTLQQSAEKIYNIEHADNVNNFINYTTERKVLSLDEFYNLFVISGESYSNDLFTLQNDRFFEYTNQEIKQRYLKFSLDDINEILALPTLFLPEYNEQNNEVENGFLGSLEEIDKVEGVRNSKFYLRKEREINMKLIESNKSKLRINEWELSRTHWSIKRANLKLVIEEITNGKKTE